MKYQQPKQRAGCIQDEVVNICPSGQKELNQFNGQRDAKSDGSRRLAGYSPQQRQEEAERHEHGDISQKVDQQALERMIHKQISQHVAKEPERNQRGVVVAIVNGYSALAKFDFG